MPDLIRQSDGNTHIGRCKCNLGEKYMFLIDNSAGTVGECHVTNQGNENVEGICTNYGGGTNGLSRYACLK